MVGKATDPTEANGADEANVVDKAAAVKAKASVTDEAKARVADEAKIDKAVLTNDADTNLDEVDEADDIVKTAEANNSDALIFYRSSAHEIENSSSLHPPHHGVR